MLQREGVAMEGVANEACCKGKVLQREIGAGGQSQPLVGCRQVRMIHLCEKRHFVRGYEYKVKAGQEAQCKESDGFKDIKHLHFCEHYEVRYVKNTHFVIVYRARAAVPRAN